MRIGMVKSSECARDDGRRLNAGYFLAEDELAVRRLLAWKGACARLGDIVSDVYSGPIFRKISVAEGQGVGYVSANDIFKADIVPSDYLSHRHGPLLDQLRLVPGTIILTCSGMNLGRSIWIRKDMEALVGSGDLIRIVPDSKMAPAGFVFAFLSSRYGVASVRRLIFGGHIKHVAPDDVGRVIVPRLGNNIERRAHQLVEEASQLRSSAAERLNLVVKEFDDLTRDLPTAYGSPRVNVVCASSIQPRFDAQYHDPVVQLIRARLRAGPSTTIGQMCTTIFLPGIFKRIHIEDVTYGAPYYTGGALFCLEPIPKGILSRRTKLYKDVELHEDTILVQAFGQDGGITGRAVWIGRHLDGATSTHMLCRLRTDNRVKTAYLFGFLNSKAALRQISILTYGGSIPHFDETGISTVVVPLLGGDEGMRAIGERVLDALERRDIALESEREARALVERAIEEGV